jgi:hypothetical protein
VDKVVAKKEDTEGRQEEAFHKQWLLKVLVI